MAGGRAESEARIARRARFAVLLAVASTLLTAAPAAALPDCPSAPAPKELLSGQGRLESILSDARGRLYYTDLNDNRLLRLDRPGDQPRVIADGMARPGGLVLDSTRTLVAGFNGGALSGVPHNGMGGLFRVDPETGAKSVFVSGLDQANGVVRGPDGSFYTSNNIGGGIAREFPDGRVQQGWADIDSPNGLAIDSTNTYLYAAQTFTPAKVSRIELANPAHVTTYFAAPPADMAAGPDGLTRDGADRLFVAANGAGQVWRVESGGRACVLARGLVLPSAAAFGGGKPGFDRTSLFVVTFTGRLLELPRATDRPPAIRP